MFFDSTRGLVRMKRGGGGGRERERRKRKRKSRGGGERLGS